MDLTSAAAFADDFVLLTYEQRIQYLNTLAERISAMRRMVQDVNATEVFVTKSTRTWSQPLKADFKGDIKNGGNGQDENLHLTAEQLYEAYENS